MIGEYLVKLFRELLAGVLLITCKYAKSQFCRVLFILLLLSFTLKKKKTHTKPSAAAFSLGCRDNCMNDCSYHLAFKLKYQFLLCLN